MPSTLRVSTAVPPLSAWGQIRTDLLARPGVQGAYIGKRMEGGLLTEEWSVVVVVGDKKRGKALSASDAVPEEVSWSLGNGVVATARTDVVEGMRRLPLRRVAANADARTEWSGYAGPGDVVERYRGRPVNTAIGMIAPHPVLGAVATTAGHGFLARRSPILRQFPDLDEHNVQLRINSNGAWVVARLRAALMDDAHDYAILSFPPDVPIANLYDDSAPLGDVHAPGPADRNRPLFVLAPRGMIPVALTGLQLHFDAGYGETFREAILTTPMTLEGDSGSLLVDDEFRPWGTLRGRFRINGVIHSVFASARLMMQSILSHAG